MKTSKFICALLLALLLQATFIQLCQAAEPDAEGKHVKDPEEGHGNSDSAKAAKKIKDGFQTAAKGSCKAKGGDKCKPDVPDLGIKGTPEIAEQLHGYWEGRRKETKDDIKKQEKKNSDQIKSKLPKQQADDIENSKKNGEKQQKAQGNLRKLFSVNNHYPNIDEGNLLAWENNYLYSIVNGYQFKIIKIEGSSLTQVYSQNIQSGQYVQEVVVANGFFALFLYEYTSVPQLVIRLYQHVPPNTVTFIQEFRRQGYLVAARELEGYLHVVTHHWQITDLGWDVSGIGYVGANINFCASWDGNGNWVRNIAAISLSLTPTYTFDAYIGCDYTTKASLAPSGNWYVASYFYSSINYSPNSLIQKVYWASPGPSQWAGLPLAYLSYQNNHWDEQGGCILRAAAYSWTSGSNLNLYAFDCTGFNQIATSGWTGPINYSVATVKWVGQNAYVTFYNEASIWKYQLNSASFTFVGTLYGNTNIYSLYEYGLSHLIGFGRPTSTWNRITVVLVNLATFTTAIEYNIVPNPSTGDYVGTTDYDGARQYIDVDFANKRVVFPIYSTNNEPFRYGFYYLHIEVSPTPCATAPPISLCGTTGTASIQNVNLVGKVYKHWNQQGQPWSTTYSESTIRSVTRPYGTLKYLYTFSWCQLQVHEDAVSSGSLPYNPIAYLDFCP